jgi:hypothetical protein
MLSSLHVNLLFTDSKPSIGSISQALLRPPARLLAGRNYDNPLHPGTHHH